MCPIPFKGISTVVVPDQPLPITAVSIKSPAPAETIELVKIIAVTEDGCIGETMDGFAVNIGDCDAEPGKYVNALIDQKTKERAALMNPTN